MEKRRGGGDALATSLATITEISANTACPAPPYDGCTATTPFNTMPGMSDQIHILIVQVTMSPTSNGVPQNPLGYSTTLIAASTGSIPVLIAVDPTSTTASSNPPTTPTVSPASSTTSTTSISGQSQTTTNIIPTSATTTSSPSPAATGQGDNNGGNFTAGSVAGAAVGAGIGAALIAFLLTFFLCGRRRKQSPGAGNGSRNQRDAYATDALNPSKGGIAVSESEKAMSGSVLAWTAFLPQSADDGTIKSSVKTFFDQLELHVDNYYTKRQVPMDAAMAQRLASIDSGKLSAPIADLAANPNTVLPMIKHSMADVLIASISPKTTSGATLLPARLATLPAKLQAGTPRTTESSGKSSYPLPHHHSLTLLFQPNDKPTAMETLNAYLYPNTEADPTYQHERDLTASQISEFFSDMFAPWLPYPDTTQTVGQNEKGLATSAANMGILLMSQPSVYEFKWEAQGGLVVFPGLWKVTDEQGRVLDQAQLLVLPVVVRT